MSILEKYNTFLKNSERTAYKLRSKEMEFLEDMFTCMQDRGIKIEIEVGALYLNVIDYSITMQIPFGKSDLYCNEFSMKFINMEKNTAFSEFIDTNTKSLERELEFWKILNHKIKPLLLKNKFNIYKFYSNNDREDIFYILKIESNLFDDKFDNQSI